MSFYTVQNENPYTVKFNSAPVPYFKNIVGTDLYIDSCEIHIGHDTAKIKQQTGCIAIGCEAGKVNQGYTEFSSDDEYNGYAVAIGHQAGNSNQTAYCIAIGFQAGQTQQGIDNYSTGPDDDKWGSIAIGSQAGQSNQLSQCVAIGVQAGNINQGGSSGNAIAIGAYAGYSNQRGNTIAIGQEAGEYNQNWDGIAIGHYAGYSNQGTYSIAIGRGAGYENQSSNSIILNANGGTLDSATSGLFVKPIRNIETTPNYYNVNYNPTTGEIVYSYSYAPGVITLYSSNVPPQGNLLCDGSQVSRTTYANLFNVIGTTYGSGDGETTFNLPNLKGRIPVGYDGSQSEFNSLGETGGEKTHTLTTDEIPSHSHSYSASNNSNQNVGYPAGGGSPDVNQGVYGATTGNTGGGLAHNNLQPYIVLNYIISY